MNNSPRQSSNSAFAMEAIRPADAKSPSPDTDPADWVKRQRAVVAIGRRAVAAPDFFSLMQDSAALIAELLETEHYAVAEPSRDGSSLRVTLSLQEPGAQGSRTFVEEVGKAGSDSLAGYVLEVARPVAVADLSQEKRFQEPFFGKHGIRSAVAVPLITQGQSFGALIAGGSRIRRHQKEDLLFAETIAHLVTTTVARSHTEEKLAEERHVADSVLQTVAALVLMLDLRGRIVRANRACERLTRFSAAELKGRPIWNVFPLPEEIGRFQAIFQKLQAGGSLVEYESSLLTKHSDQLRIAWSYAAVSNAKGSIESIIATGIDITGQRQAEQKAQRAEEAVETARRATKRALGLPSDELPLFGGPEGASADLPLDPYASAAIAVHGERRRSPRRSYPYHQAIAPILNEKLPDRADFVQVPCKDIAAGGFSYFSPTPPPSDELIVALGTPPRLTYIAAQVIHVTRVRGHGKHRYVVGCAYIGRARY